MPKKKKSFSNNNKFLKLAFSFFIAVIAGLGHAFFQAQKPKELIPVKVGLTWIHQAQFAGIYTAIEKGFYEDAGLIVEAEEFSRGVDYEDQLANGELDFTVSQPISLMDKADKGSKIKAIAAIYQTSPLAFLYKKETKLDSPNDFKGKRFGVKGNSVSGAGTILFSALLSELELTKNDISLRALDFSTHDYNDIRNNKVDAMSIYRTNQPYIFTKNNIPFRLILPEDFGFDMYGDVLVASDEMIENNPKLVQAFVDATLKGWEYAMEHQEEAVAFTSKYVTSKDYQDLEYSSFILEESMPLIDGPGGRDVGYMTADKWETLYNALLGSDLITNEFEIERVFTDQFIK